MSLRASRYLLCPLVILSAVCAGCGGNSGMAPVIGVVTMNGRPATGIIVVFHPRPESGEINAKTRPAMAIVDGEGRYELSTYVEGDGAVVGTHRISIESVDREVPLPGRLSDEREVEVVLGENTFDLELISFRR